MVNEDLLVANAVKAWKSSLERADKLFAPLTDAQLQAEVAPGKNRLVYLLGHLAAVHDGMLPLLGLGPRRHPHYDAIFIEQPDRAVGDLPSAAQLKAVWIEVNGRIVTETAAWTAVDWLVKHNAVSLEDFAKDPSRNRFAILITRTNHLNYHTGQAALAPKG